MNSNKLQDAILKSKNEVAASFGMTWDQVLMDRSLIDGAMDMVIKRILRWKETNTEDNLVVK